MCASNAGNDREGESAHNTVIIYEDSADEQLKEGRYQGTSK